MVEEIRNVKESIEETETMTMQMMNQYKEKCEEQKLFNKRIFIIWLLTFLLFLGVNCYTLYLLNTIK